MCIKPIMIWLGFSLFAASYNETAFWKSFILIALIHLPALWIYFFFDHLLKKKADFFMSFREKPFLWLSFGIIMLLGQLLLKDVFFCGSYLFIAFLPFLWKFLIDFSNNKLKWLLLGLSVALGIWVLFHKIPVIAFSAVFVIWILGKVIGSTYLS